MRIILDNRDLEIVHENAKEKFKAAHNPAIRSELQMVSRVIEAYHEFLAKHGLAMDLELQMPKLPNYEPIED